MITLFYVKNWARKMKLDTTALWLAARDARTPLFAKLLALTIVAYALSPIDLIPDFIPVLGVLDDLLIVPLGIMLVLKLMPPALMAEFREKAALLSARPKNNYAAAAIIILWLLTAAICLLWLRSLT